MAGAADLHPGALHLLSNQPRTRLHSQYDHGPLSRQAKVAQREPVRIHPADAAERGIAATAGWDGLCLYPSNILSHTTSTVTDGDIVMLSNGRGRCLAGASRDDRLRRGVVVLSTGAWYDPERPYELEVHGNPNVLTADVGTSKLAQGPSTGNTIVWVERYRGEPPPVRAFSPPPIRPYRS